MNKTNHHGSCLCGAVKFQAHATALRVSHCHCIMCQKQHGAAYASYATFNESDIKIVQGKNNITSFKSTDTVIRNFCDQCGSNISWQSTTASPARIGYALGIFDSTFEKQSIKDIFTESNACWLSTLK